MQRAIAAKLVLVDGQAAKSSTRLKSGQIVTVEPIQTESEAAIPENIDLEILFEDDYLVAINKAPGMVVHPAKGHWAGTLTSALAYHFEKLSSIGGLARPGIVHRLDRDTSGVILIAKTDASHLSLSKQFEERKVEKEYFAIVSPVPDRDRDLIDKPIGAHPYQREKKAIRVGHSTSRAATTFYEVIDRFRGFASVSVKPKTGRTHQIRVHLAHIGTPVLCDALYSGRARLTMKEITKRAEDELPLLERQALHAHRISFSHPQSGKQIEIVAELPKDIRETLETIREYR